MSDSKPHSVRPGRLREMAEHIASDYPASGEDLRFLADELDGLLEQFETRDDALRDILDVTENWTRFKTDEEKLRAIAGIAKAALPKVSSPAKEPDA